MAKKVKITIQNTTDEGMNFHETKEVVADDGFDLFEDYYSYMNGTKKQQYKVILIYWNLHCYKHGRFWFRNLHGVVSG